MHVQTAFRGLSPSSHLCLCILLRGGGEEQAYCFCAFSPFFLPLSLCMCVRALWGDFCFPPLPTHTSLTQLLLKDTLRDCTHDDRSCLSNLQFISPLYFVSFVLTAQFVLINVVVAVLMKHLDDSNKEAQEDAEMDAEIELEMAHGLCPRSSSSPGSGQDGGGGRVDPEGHLCMTCYSPAQVGGTFLLSSETVAC